MALPVKNQAFILPIRLYKTDGTRITAPGTVTAKVMQDSDLTWDTVGTATKLADGRGTINLELTAGEMNADRVDYEVWDDTASCMVQTGTIFTCSATRGLAGTALPDAAADAAGGLPISDAGGLDLDTYIKRLEAAFTSTIAARIDENISAAKTLTAAYDAAKTAATAGAKMDLVDAPNSAAVTAIQSGLSTLSAGDVADAVWDESTTSHTSSGTFGRLLNLLRKLLFNQQVDSGNSVENFDDDGETSLGTASWSESTGTRGKHTVAW